MRDLKFRVWDDKNKKFCYCYNLVFVSRNESKMLDGISRLVGQVYSETQLFYIQSKDAKTTNPRENTYQIQQYTGLKDKDGREIYEGDIVEYKNKKHKIKYSIDAGGDYPFAGFTIISLKPVDLETGKLLDCMNCQVLNIIGNIFENPELL